MFDVNEITQEQVNAGLEKVKEAIINDEKRFTIASIVGIIACDDVHTCNSPMCIGGWLANILSNYKSESLICRVFSNLHHDDRFKLHSLFYPDKHLYSIITVKDACDAIDQYLSGNQDNPWYALAEY